MFLEVTLFSLIVLLWVLVKDRRKLDINGKSVLITGCDSGIGLHLAEQLHTKGFQVLAACLSSSSLGFKKLQEMNSDKMHPLIMDVTDNQSVQKCVEEVEKITKSDLWAVINNAGVCIFGEFDWLTWHQCEQQIAVNFLGVVRVTKYFLPLIKKSSGRLLTISSVCGFVAFPGTAIYSGTKFALEGFCDSLRIELKKIGVAVTVVQLGDFAKCTSIMANHMEHAKEMKRNMSKDDLELYDNYFDCYHEKSVTRAGLASPTTLESTTLADDIANCLLFAKPKARVVISQVAYFTYVKFLHWMPICVRDSILTLMIDKLFQLKFKGRNK